MLREAFSSTSSRITETRARGAKLLRLHRLPATIKLGPPGAESLHNEAKCLDAILLYSNVLDQIFSLMTTEGLTCGERVELSFETGEGRQTLQGSVVSSVKISERKVISDSRLSFTVNVKRLDGQGCSQAT